MEGPTRLELPDLVGRDVIPGQSFLQLRGQELGVTHNITPHDVATRKETKADAREKK